MKRTKIIVAIVITGMIFGLAMARHATQAQSVSKEDALSIALKQAGLSADKVSGYKIEREKENGKDIFDVEFIHDQTKYDIDVDAKSGKILSVESEHYYPKTTRPSQPSETTPPTQEKTSFISKTEALRMASDHVNISSTKVEHVEIDLEIKKGVMVYEVEFIHDGFEYEIIVDANTGEIIEMEKETVRFTTDKNDDDDDWDDKDDLDDDEDDDNDDLDDDEDDNRD